MNSQSKGETTISVTTQKRAYALDALRGFAVLAMVLSGTISYKILPAWMYHAQVPPPAHIHNPNLPGLTWVDLVFPLFLFSMGASIPLALSRRLSQGVAQTKVILYILKRGFFLATFAIVLQHFRPSTISQELIINRWIIALLGFVILFFMFVRLPDSLGKLPRRIITIGAWIAAVILLSTIEYTDRSGFSLARSDIILIVLANTAVFGSIIWLFTRSKLWLRVGLMGLLLALRLSATSGKSWIAFIWLNSPLPGIFQFQYLSYLFVVIPGTIAGDLILNWIRNSTPNDSPELEEELYQNTSTQRSNHRFYWMIFLVFVNCLVLLIGLQSRWVWQTTLLSAVICWLGALIIKKPTNETEYLLKNFYHWGVYWLALGLLFEPFQGGIKKDPSTLSYYFVTTGMAFFILIIFTILIDIFKMQRWLHLLIDNGQNPMIGYVGFANLVWPILIITRIDGWVIQNIKTPVHGFLKGLIYTLLVAYIVSWFTKLKLFWRT